MPKIVKLNDIAKKQGFKLGDNVLRIGGYDMIDELDFLFMTTRENSRWIFCVTASQKPFTSTRKTGSLWGLNLTST